MEVTAHSQDPDPVCPTPRPGLGPPLCALIPGSQDSSRGLGDSPRSPGITPLFLPQMWKFTQSRWVVRKEVAAVTKVSGVLLDLRPRSTTAGMGAEWGWACLTWPPPRSSARKT